MFRRRSDRDDRDARAKGWEAYQRGHGAVRERRFLEAADESAKAGELVPDSVHSRCQHGAALANAGRPFDEVTRGCLRACLRSHAGIRRGAQLDRHGVRQLGRCEVAQWHHGAWPRSYATRRQRRPMRKLNMDYCRECHRPVHRTDAVEGVDVSRPRPHRPASHVHDLSRRSSASAALPTDTDYDPAPALPPMRWRARADGPAVAEIARARPSPRRRGGSGWTGACRRPR